jgi:hypothetical protein
MTKTFFFHYLFFLYLDEKDMVILVESKEKDRYYKKINKIKNNLGFNWGDKKIGADGSSHRFLFLTSRSLDEGFAKAKKELEKDLELDKIVVFYGGAMASISRDTEYEDFVERMDKYRKQFEGRIED